MCLTAWTPFSTVTYVLADLPTTSLKEFCQSYERGCLLSYRPKTPNKTELTVLRLCDIFFQLVLPPNTSTPQMLASQTQANLCKLQFKTGSLRGRRLPLCSAQGYSNETKGAKFPFLLFFLFLPAAAELAPGKLLCSAHWSLEGWWQGLGC